ncbi:hypothetical protein FKR81_31715 [Lentzea tibetensis]|uniref:Uncharacterized protein n=1 Tax=Lentzea tibetensis TaxID=2591470 RepID=A0A563EKI2_9PSEU|nr:hypothetical protein [Lentzea tibetensis]TWP47532.1 hypothetical protein FKR81_31715 [Lentzea tibetensis]
MKDPLTAWDGPFPYDVFADIGITPESSHAEVQNASFKLLRDNRFTHEARVAWDELRLRDRRLFVDLFVFPGGDR